MQPAVHDFGGSGAPLLIAHATGFCAGAYEPLAAALSRHFHVWGVDFRGHGDSPAPANGDFDWSGMADDVLAAVDAIGATEVVVGFGHSMGGAALLLAESKRAGVLRSAYVFEPIVMPFRFPPTDGASVSMSPSPMSAAARRRRPSFASREDALMRYATRPPLNALRADALAAYVNHGFADDDDGSVRLKCEPENEARTFEAASITVDDVRSVGVRVTVAAGDRDVEAAPAMFAPVVAEALSNAELIRYPHLGHFGPLQDPDGVAADVIARFG